MKPLSTDMHLYGDWWNLGTRKFRSTTWGLQLSAVILFHFRVATGTSCPERLSREVVVQPLLKLVAAGTVDGFVSSGLIRSVLHELFLHSTLR